MKNFKERIISMFCEIFAMIDGQLNGVTESISGVTAIPGGMTVPLNLPINLNSFSFITAAIRPAAMTILSICIMLEFVTMLTRSDMMRLENIVMAAGKYTLCKGVIDAAPGILNAIYDLVRGISAAVALSLNFSEKAKEELIKYMDVMNWADAIVALIISLVPLLIAFLAAIIIKIMVYAYMFELAFYYAVSPIPCAFAPYNEGGAGFNHTTIKYFRGFAAVCLQGTFMIACIKIFEQNVISQIASMTSFNGLIFGTMGSLLLLTFAMTKCGGWAKSIMDAA